jgi:hypothetical protein
MWLHDLDAVSVLLRRHFRPLAHYQIVLVPSDRLGELSYVYMDWSLDIDYCMSVKSRAVKQFRGKRVDVYDHNHSPE